MQQYELIALINALNLDEKIDLESIPNLDLYMDQVITLFEEKLNHTKRFDSDKLLTKTMINNYIKDKVLMPAVKKKYTKEHIILMIMLYELKQVLSISDIKALFSTVIKEDAVDGELLKELYEGYLDASQMNKDLFMEEAQCISSYTKEKVEKLNAAYNINMETSQLEDMLEVVLLTQKANYYKRLAEKIIDEKIAINQIAVDKKKNKKNRKLDMEQ